MELKKGLKHHGWVMGHGWGLHGGTWNMGGWDQNIVTRFDVICFEGWGCPGIKKHIGPPDMFWWVVGLKVLVLRFMFCGAQFSASWNEHWTAIETHVSVSIWSKALAARAWKLVLGRFEVNNTFMTCFSNNVRPNQTSSNVGQINHLWYYACKEPYMRGLLTTRVLGSL